MGNVRLLLSGGGRRVLEGKGLEKSSEMRKKVTKRTGDQKSLSNSTCRGALAGKKYIIRTVENGKNRSAHEKFDHNGGRTVGGTKRYCKSSRGKKVPGGVANARWKTI